MYCPKCFRLNDDNAEKCCSCGHPFQHSHNSKASSVPGTKFCVHCGNELLAAAVICPKCGCDVSPTKNTSTDKPSTILDIIAMLVPILGFIMYLVFHKDFPIKAKSVGISALVGVAAWILFPVFLVAIIGLL